METPDRRGALMPAFLYLAGVAVGLVIAFVLIMGVEAVGHSLFPLPEDIDASDLEALAAAMDRIPLGNLLMVLVAWGAGSFAGGYMAAWISKRYRLAAALSVGVLLMALGLVNLLLLPHPWWFWIGWVVIFVPLAWLGAKLAPRPAPPATG